MKDGFAEHQQDLQSELPNTHGAMLVKQDRDAGLSILSILSTTQKSRHGNLQLRPQRSGQSEIPLPSAAHLTVRNNARAKARF